MSYLRLGAMILLAGTVVTNDLLAEDGLSYWQSPPGKPLGAAKATLAEVLTTDDSPAAKTPSVEKELPAEEVAAQVEEAVVNTEVAVPKATATQASATLRATPATSQDSAEPKAARENQLNGSIDPLVLPDSSDQLRAQVLPTSDVDSWEPALQPVEDPLTENPLPQNLDLISDCESCQTPVCSCCATSPGVGWFIHTEAVLLRYHRSDGMRVGTGPGETVNPGYDLTPRVTAGLSSGGLGFRARWWDYSHNQRSQANVPGEFLSVDTYNIDAEVYEIFALNCDWTLELSGGVRYNEFEEVLVDNDSPLDVRRNRFTGLGGIVGLQAKRELGCGHVYGGLRTSVLFGDKYRINGGQNFATGSFLNTFDNSIVGTLEVNVGYEKRWQLETGSVVFSRIGAEWQNWYGYSSALGQPVAFGGINGGEEVFESHADVGFFGFSASIGLMR